VSGIDPPTSTLLLPMKLVAALVPLSLLPPQEISNSEAVTAAVAIQNLP
jgi:hypothetical protein